MNNTFNFNVEGITIYVDLSIHARKRMKQRNINGYQISGALMMMGEEILSMKNGHEFIIIDDELNSSYVFAIYADLTGEITINVITVVDVQDIYNKRGTQILKLKGE